jgi:uncharacterized repeat protein (TIGR01451 family)
VKKKHLLHSAGALFCCAAASLAFAALTPQMASAATTASHGTAANANILNIVTVTYYDATGTNKHQAATSTSVTVTVKQAALTVTNQVPFVAVDSSSKATSYVALTSNANGPDTYKVTVIDTTTNLSSKTITTTIAADPVDTAATTALGAGNTLTIGATSIVSAGTPGTTQVLYIPGGTLNGIAVNSTVVIEGTSYRVTGIFAGNVAGYNVTGSSTALGQPTAEQYGSITIGADPYGSNVAPNFTSPVAGTIIAERKYLKIEDTGVVATNNADGTDDITVSTSTPAGTYTAALTTPDQATFIHVQVSINKSVANKTDPAASGTGKPGDILEYTVTVSNATQGNAGNVSVSDAVPAYTTLYSGPTYGATGGIGALTEIFATIDDGTNKVNITLDPADAEQPANTNVGFGGATGTAAGKAITFNLGAGSSSSTGGTVAKQTSYVIKYQVKIN